MVDDAFLQALVDAAGPVPIHMDGARLFNAEVATGVPAAEWASAATTVMCCLSKGLCAPVGSLLAGDEDVMAEARLARKRLGGGMRQAGVLAAPGSSPCTTWSAACTRITNGRRGWRRPWRCAGPGAGSILTRCARTS